MEQSNITTGSPLLQRADGRPFCLSYHLKGVCNSNCGGHHAHRMLSPHNWGILSAWKSRFCAETHPVADISAPPWTPGGVSVGNTTLSTRSRRSQGSHGTRSRDSKLWQTTPPAARKPLCYHRGDSVENFFGYQHQYSEEHNYISIS